MASQEVVLPFVNDTMQSRRFWKVSDGMHRIVAVCGLALDRKDNGDPKWFRDLFFPAVVIKRDAPMKAVMSVLQNKVTQCVSRDTLADKITTIKKLWEQYQADVFPVELEQHQKIWAVYDAAKQAGQSPPKPEGNRKLNCTQPKFCAWCGSFKLFGKKKIHRVLCTIAIAAFPKAVDLIREIGNKVTSKDKVAICFI
jgi:hypothetical protein